MNPLKCGEEGNYAPGKSSRQITTGCGGGLCQGT